MSKVWQEERFNPPQHPQPANRNPFRTVTLDARLHVPAWFALHLQLACRERDQTLEGFILDCLTDEEPLERLWEEALVTRSDLRDRWRNQYERLPREDPHPNQPAGPLTELLSRARGSEGA